MSNKGYYVPGTHSHRAEDHRPTNPQGKVCGHEVLLPTVRVQGKHLLELIWGAPLTFLRVLFFAIPIRIPLPALHLYKTMQPLKLTLYT